MNTFKLPDETRVSRVHLRTATLAGILEFYQKVLGLRVIDCGESEASLSATGNPPALLVFTEARKATPRPHPATGLYHFAIRFPTRRDLAQAFLRVVAADYPLDGTSDHGLHESIYLRDPDGNGVELTADRPRSEWPRRKGRLHMFTQALYLDGLLATTGGDPIPANAPAQTDIGHIHLCVADLKEAEKCFHEFLGFEVMARVPDATFLALGGYHHHVAVNTRAGKTPAPANAVGLISYRFAVPNAQALANVKDRARLFGYEAQMAGDILQVRDPNGHGLELELA